jgi:hypothetical protein
MVQMEMAQKEVDAPERAIEQVLAQAAQARARVKDQDLLGRI